MIISERETKQTRGTPKLTFEDAAAKLYLMGITKRQQFKELSRAKERPDDIPSSPHTFYSEFTTWGEMVSVGKEAAMRGKGQAELLPPYEELKALLRRYSITSQRKYRSAVNSGRLGAYAPKSPDVCYKTEFEGWDNFLAPTSRFVDFNTARSLARTYQLKTSGDWVEFCREGCRPSCIPALPNRDYPQFTTWHDFLVGDEPKDM